MIEQAVYDILRNDALVEAIAGDRIYPLLMPQNATYPAITYQRISTDRARSLSGRDYEKRVRLQVDVWSKTFGEAKSLSTAVAAALDDYAGVLAGLQIGACSLVDERDEFESKADYFRSSLDFLIGYEE